MIKCGKLEDTNQCILYSKDGSKVLGRFPYSKHEGQKGAKAAAHKREGQIQFFKKKHRELVDALDIWGAPNVLKYLLEKTAGCEACQEVTKSYVEQAGTDQPEPEVGAKVEKKKKPYGGSFSQMWEKKYGGSVEKCMAMVKGKVANPGAYCAWLKDKALKRTTWRGKGKHEKKSFEEVVEEALTMLQKDERTDLDALLEGVDLADLEAWLESEMTDEAEPVEEPAPVEEPVSEETPEPETEPVEEPEPEIPPEPEGPPTFVDFLRREHAERRAGVLAMLGESEEAE